MPFVCYLYILVCHTNVTRMYLYDIRMSLACARMSSVCRSYVLVCRSYVLVCHPYVTCMYSYVICMSLVCTRMSSVCNSYVILMSLACGFTMNPTITNLMFSENSRSRVIQITNDWFIVDWSNFLIAVIYFLKWTRKTWFFREEKCLAPSIYLAKFC